MPNLYNTQPPYNQVNTGMSSPLPANTYYPQASPTGPANMGGLMTIFVNSEDDVNSYPIAPGTSVMLISFEKQKFWIKSRGNDGVPQPLRVFPFKEEQPVANNQNGAVTREEFNSLCSKFDKLLEELGGTK